jgi:uncharacterized membrane protein
MLKEFVIPYIVILVLFLVIDLPVILYLNKDMYQKQFIRINKDNIKSGSHVWISGAIAYLLLALGIYFFVVKQELVEEKEDYLKIFTKGSVLGLIIYGIYNGTNKATINEWGTEESIKDTIWGTILSGLLSVSSVYILKKIMHKCV